MICRSGFVALLALPCLFPAPPLTAQVPARSEAGLTLEVPEADLDRGLVYHAQPGEDTQVLLQSRAELQHATLVTGRMVGYLVTPFDLVGDMNPILAGAFRIPVHSLSSGASQVDEILRSASYFDAENHPEITFLVTSVTRVERLSEKSETPTFTLNIQGRLGVKEHTISIQFPARLRFMPTTMKTLARNVGDMLTLQARFDLKPRELGWQPERVMLDRISETLQVDLYLMLNTISPDRSLDPRDDPALYRKQLRFVTLLRDLNDPVAAYTYGRELMQEVWSKPDQLHRMARAVIDTSGVSRRDFLFALQSAERATQLKNEQDADILETLADIHFEIGDYAMAADWQEKAIQRLKTTGSPTEALEKRLHIYQQEARASRIHAKPPANR